MRTEITALLLTIITEFLIYFALVRKGAKGLFLNSFLINLMTQPIANLMIVGTTPKSSHEWWVSYLLTEVAVIGVETPLIRLLFKTEWRSAFLISLVANAISASLVFVF